MIKTIYWQSGIVELIDQRLLPHELKYVKCRNARDIYEAIRMMKIRGAPAIGIAAAFGIYLGVRNSGAKGFTAFKKDFTRVSDYLSRSRPTANDLFWAMSRIEQCVNISRDKPIKEIKRRILEEAKALLEEDIKKCRSIGDNGKELLGKGSGILTHCNAGGLATAGYGTALGVIFSAGKRIKNVYVDETRPRLQGARLTMWELENRGIPCTLICDNTAGDLMRRGEIDAVIVGADRIASNGDAANKIGTYSAAVLAEYHKIPFYVAAPFSTFDLSLHNGAEIPIEERPQKEVKEIRGKMITTRGAKALNRAFDVTPAELITGIITEKGFIKAPNRSKISKMAGK